MVMDGWMNGDCLCVLDLDRSSESTGSTGGAKIGQWLSTTDVNWWTVSGWRRRA